MHPKKKKKLQEKKVAKQHIKELFIQADNIFATNQSLAHRYIHIARSIQMKFKVHMPKEFKRKYCKHCYYYIRSGTNGRVRTRDGKLIIYCNNCRKFTRTPFKN